MGRRLSDSRRVEANSIPQRWDLAAYNIVHVAVAKLLRAKALVSFDGRQRTLAAAVGLTVES